VLPFESRIEIFAVATLSEVTFQTATPSLYSVEEPSAMIFEPTKLSAEVACCD